MFLLASLEALLVTVSSALEKRKTVLSFYITIDGSIIGTVAFLQINTIRKTNALHNESTVSTSKRINKKITKLSMRIMLLYSFFSSPHVIVYFVVFLRLLVWYYQKIRYLHSNNLLQLTCISNVVSNVVC